MKNIRLSQKLYSKLSLKIFCQYDHGHTLKRNISLLNLTVVVVGVLGYLYGEIFFELLHWWFQTEWWCKSIDIYRQKDPYLIVIAIGWLRNNNLIIVEITRAVSGLVKKDLVSTWSNWEPKLFFKNKAPEDGIKLRLMDCYIQILKQHWFFHSILHYVVVQMFRPMIQIIFLQNYSLHD